jgi:hypothetical protein
MIFPPNHILTFLINCETINDTLEILDIWTYVNVNSMNVKCIYMIIMYRICMSFCYKLICRLMGYEIAKG